MDEIFDVVFADDTLAWELQPNRTWARVEGEGKVDTHEALQELALLRANAHLV
jgi:hypothetical protein